ncbi:hypothetical protein FGE12_14240 [Aggregicoccus sp. 17bor-14]|nr:hypothetical protein [Aggregicoccus sp. 17bor-14]
MELTPANWAALQQEFQEDPSRETEFPVTFRYGDEVYPDATLRLRGNHSSCGNKMQFAIAFNHVNDQGRFHGLRRLNLDHGGCHHLEERLALSFMRDLGLPAACSNHARLVVNGQYYGLFGNIEHVNQDFLKRQFGKDADDGNLWKSGNKLRTNEDTGDTSDVQRFWSARTLAQLSTLADLDEAVQEWAAEATLPARDNFWMFGWNYYLYHHPTRGFLFIPTDLDRSISLFPSGADDNFFRPETLQPPADLVLADPAWNARYLAAARRSAQAFEAARLNARVDAWWAQIADAARTDPHARYKDEDVVRLKEAVRLREAWLRGWLERNP